MRLWNIKNAMESRSGGQRGGGETPHTDYRSYVLTFEFLQTVCFILPARLLISFIYLLTWMVFPSLLWASIFSFRQSILHVKIISSINIVLSLPRKNCCFSLFWQKLTKEMIRKRNRPTTTLIRPACVNDDDSVCLDGAVNWVRGEGKKEGPPSS